MTNVTSFEEYKNKLVSDCRVLAVFIIKVEYREARLKHPEAPTELLLKSIITKFKDLQMEDMTLISFPSIIEFPERVSLFNSQTKMVYDRLVSTAHHMETIVDSKLNPL